MHMGGSSTQMLGDTKQIFGKHLYIFKFLGGTFIILQNLEWWKNVKNFFWEDTCPRVPLPRSAPAYAYINGSVETNYIESMVMFVCKKLLLILASAFLDPFV